MTSRTVRGGVRPVDPSPREHLRELFGGIAQVGLEYQPCRRPVGELVLGEHLEHEVEHGLARIERLHVDVDVGTELAGVAQQRAQALGGVATAALGSVGAEQGGQRRDLDRHVGARDRPDAVALEHLAAGPARLDTSQLDERLIAPRGVAVGLGLGHGGLAQQVDRAGHAVIPQLPEHAEGRPRRLADDEPVRHVANPSRGGRPERGAGGPIVGDPHGRRQRRRARPAPRAGTRAGGVPGRPASGRPG